MTYEEIRNICDSMWQADLLNGDIQKVMEALEKQKLPKKPILEADGYSDGELVYDTWYCPNCDKSYEVDYDRYNFCPNCGQRIDWSDEE